MPTKTKTAAKPAPKAKKREAERLSLKEAMSALEKAGSAQTRKTYARHGATEPMFGVSFATLGSLVKRIKVDHDLALALWKTGNFDAQNLAVKIADPARMSPGDLDRWAGTPTAPMCGGYVAHLAVEGHHARSRADAWLASPNAWLRASGWQLVAAMALKDEATPDSWFARRLTEIEKTIHEAPNDQRAVMNRAVIAIGCRDAAFRKLATAAAKRIGAVEVDHGNTSCKTPEAVTCIEKTWAHSTSKGFASPAAHERSRESMRTRC